MSDFDGFYAQHQQRLIRLCWLLTLDDEDAVEVAQEAMTRAWRNWESISGVGSNPAAWTNRVAVNLSSNRRRSHGTRKRWRHLFEQREPVAPATEYVDLHRALAGLSRRQREVVVLHYWEDLDLAGCAELMGISVGSAKTHLSRARSTLRNVAALTLEDV